MSTRLTTRQSPNLQMLMTYELHQLFFPRFFRPQQIWSLNIVTVGIMNGRDIFEMLMLAGVPYRFHNHRFISWLWTGDDFMAQVGESLMWRLFTIFSEFTGLLDLVITVARSCEPYGSSIWIHMYGHLRFQFQWIRCPFKYLLLCNQQFSTKPLRAAMAHRQLSKILRALNGFMWNDVYFCNPQASAQVEYIQAKRDCRQAFALHDTNNVSFATAS